jgi:hypothetical protein
MKKTSTSSANFQPLSAGPSARALAPARRLACAAALACAALVAVPAHAAPIDTLIKAVKFDDVDGVNKLLAKGMDPNSVDNQGIPLLVIAAREKSDKVAAALLANPKTDIEIQDKAGENALMMARSTRRAGRRCTTRLRTATTTSSRCCSTTRPTSTRARRTAPRR